MTGNLVYVIGKENVINGICGPNDENLAQIEKLLGSNIFLRGNEIFVETQNEEKQQILQKMIDELSDYTDKGLHPGTEVINSIYESVTEHRQYDLELLKKEIIEIPSGYRPVYPRGTNQARYLTALRTQDMIFGIGPAGTGKTYLAVAAALSQLLDNSFKRLVVTRPIVEAGENLGFLPGDLTQKINPYLRPIYDAMYSLVPFDVIQRMRENEVLEIAPLAYMRGRSLNESVIILDEAQNTSLEQMKMFLTRMGEGSRVIVTGDVTQIDLPARKMSGLVHATQILSHIKEISMTRFDSSDVVRNPLVKKIINAYEKKEAEKSTTE